MRDLAFPIELLAGDTLRETDGLAMRSRNQYLSAEERPKAALIHRTLRRMAEATQAGRAREEVEGQARQALADAGFEVDYAVVRTPGLAEPDQAAGARVALIAARLGRTRLIDNLEFTTAAG